MENHRVAVKEAEQEIRDIEMAHYVLLSLYREYSVRFLNDLKNKDDYASKMRRIKQDMRYLTSKELIAKTNQLYLPILKNMMENQSGK